MPNKITAHKLKRYHSGFLSARIGEWLYTLALNWLVLTETSSPLLLAVINACRLLPSLVLSVPAGKLADRFERRYLNRIIAVLNTALVALTGVAFYFGLPFELCAGLVVLRAVVTAAEAPIRNAFLCGILSGDDLKSAVAQNASVMNLGRILGPALAGVSLAKLGGPATFALASVFCAVYFLVLEGLKVDSHPELADCPCLDQQPSVLKDLKQRPQLGKLIWFALPIMFFGFPYTAMLPLFTEAILKLGPEELGVLVSVAAAGALSASSFLSVNPGEARWTQLRNYALGFGLALTVFSTATSFMASAISLFLVGALGQAYRTSSRMMFQDLVPRGCAGRMMGLALMDRGMIPLGALLIGFVAEAFGARMGFMVMGLGSMTSVALLSRSLHLRD